MADAIPQPIDYSQRIPNNVDLANDRTLQRALERWQPAFLNWWNETGPANSANLQVYLRTAISVDRDGWATGTQVVSNSLALLPVALLPTLVGLAGSVYFLVALLLGLGLLWSAVMLARSGSAGDARRLLFASLVYLPVLLAVMALDKLGS